MPPTAQQLNTQQTAPQIPAAQAPASAPSPLRSMGYAAGAASLSPAKAPVGALAAGVAKRIDETQSKEIDAKGYGSYTGTHSGEEAKDGKQLKKTDCTIYVLDVLRQAFAAAGRSDDWTRVFADAKRTSNGAFKGTELMKSLQTNLGWIGVFWGKDSNNPDAEHSYSARKAKKGGGYYGIQVDPDKVVTDYAPADESRKTTTNLEKLRRVKFGVLGARGGSHMAMLLNGQVYEVHWSNSADSHDLFEARPLEEWGWESGAVVMPPEELASWNGT